MLVDPLHSCGKDSSVRGLLCHVRLSLAQRVSGLKLAPIEGGAVANDDLGGVLVWHHHGGFGQLGAHCVRVVWHEGLLGHANVVVGLLAESFPLTHRKYNE